MLKTHNPIKAVIFDMDGVIIDSEPLFDVHMLTHLPSLGIKTSKDYIEQFRGTNIVFQWEVIKRDFNLHQPLEELMQNARSSYYNFLLQRKLKPITGVKPLIKKLKKQGHALAVASSASAKRIDLFLSKTNLKDFFSVILCGDDAKRSKPAPDIYLEAAKRLNIFPNNCIVIEDAKNGVVAAKNAGMKVIGFKVPPHNKQDLSEANHIVRNIKEISFLSLANL